MNGNMSGRNLRILAMSIHDEPAFVVAMTAAGARGCSKVTRWPILPAQSAKWQPGGNTSAVLKQLWKVDLRAAQINAGCGDPYDDRWS